MNSQELNRVYEALQNAHNAGDTKAAEQLAQYARQLEDQTKLDTTPFASSEGGIGDKYLHNPLTYGAAGFFGGMAVPEAMSKVANVVTPKPRPTPSAVPSTPSVQSAPAAVSQHPGSLGPGAVKNIQHNIGQVIGNDLHLGLARNPVPGFGLAPDAIVITPNNMKGAAPAAPKARPSISAMKNAVKNAMQAQHPVPPGRLRGALSGGVALGSGIDAVQQAREGNVLPAAASTLSTLGGVGMASKNPKVALAGGLAALLGTGGRMLFGNKEEEKEPEPPADKNWMWGGKQFAAGGAIQGYNKGKKVIAEKAVEGALGLIGRGPKTVQTVSNPLRMDFPGIYLRPDVIAQRAVENTAPESPLLKQLFGVTRDDLFEMSKRKGNMPGVIPGAAKNPKGSAAAEAVMNPRNETRILDIMSELRSRAPGMYQGMHGWYTMDPAYQRLVQLVGKDEAGRLYKQLNTFGGIESPNMPVPNEFRRASAAHMLAEQNRWPDWVKYGGLREDQKLNMPDFPSDLISVPGRVGHQRASTSQTKYLQTGEHGMDSPKAPPYIEASGVPEIGFQTDIPVGDAHWSRGIGLADVRTGKSTAESVTTPEIQQLAPWWRTNIADQMGTESVPAQAILWGGLGPYTGVKTAVGAPKLELHAIEIGKAAQRLGISPEKARDLILMGKERAGKKEGGLIHLAGGGQPIKMFQQLYRGYAGKPGAEEIFASPQKRVAEYYAQKRAAQTGLQPGVEAVQVDPSAGVKYGHALPIDQFNRDVVTTQARKLSPLDVLNPAPNKLTEAELGIAEYFDNMRKQAQAQRARSAEALRQRAQHYANLQGPQPRSDMGRSVADLAEFMESRYK